MIRPTVSPRPRALNPLAAPRGGCTTQTLRCFDARDYRAKLRPCCRAHIVKIVTASVAALDEHGVTYWADYGTLLGAVRNPMTTWADYPWLPQDEPLTGPLTPGIVPHDKDADFGLLASDWPKLMRVRAALERQGFDVRVNVHALSMKVRLSYYNQTNLDLFSWRDKAPGLLARPRYIQVDNYKGRDFPKAMLFPLTLVPWEGMMLPAPHDPEAFCAMRYGSTWRTPVPNNHDGVRR